MSAGHPVSRILYWRAWKLPVAAAFESAAGLTAPAPYYGKRGVFAVHEQFSVYE